MDPMLAFAFGVIFGVVLVLISVRMKLSCTHELVKSIRCLLLEGDTELAKALHTSSGALKAAIKEDQKV